MLTELPPLPQCDILDPGRFGVAWQEESVRAYGQACQAATLATVTPLVQQMVNAHYQHQQAQVAFLLAVKSSDAAAGQLERAYIASAAELDRAAGNLDAFLSGATKESTDHG